MIKHFYSVATALLLFTDICSTQSIDIDLERIEKPLSLHTSYYTQQITMIEPIKIALENVRDIQYRGDLYIGSSGQKLSFVFDTGSIWTWIANSDCSTCSDQGMELYEEDESETYSRLDDSVSVIHYGQGNAYGYFSQEQICLKEKEESRGGNNATTQGLPARETHSCIDDFKMLSVIRIEELSGLMSDGVVGLAPTSHRTQASVLIDDLYWNRVINDRVFSFKLNPLADGAFSSKLTLGSYTLPTGYTSDDINWNKIQNPYFWSVPLNSVRLGNRTITLETDSAIIDTGNSNIVAPSKAFEQFRSFFSKKMLCDINAQGEYQCLCHENDYQNNFPTLIMHIGDKEYYIPKESYVNY